MRFLHIAYIYCTYIYLKLRNLRGIGRGKTTGIQNYPASNIVYYVDIKTVLKIFQMHLASPERFYEPGAPFSSVEDGVPSGLDARNSFSYTYTYINIKQTVHVSEKELSYTYCTYTYIRIGTVHLLQKCM
jgi:hypothetical protein